MRSTSRAGATALAFAAVVLILGGCAGTPSGAAVVGDWGSQATGQPHLTIQNDGAFSGSDGCNSLSGKGSINGDVITFGPIASTLKACEGVDEWLGKAASGTVSGKTMTVTDSSGTKIGTLEKSN
ncbi:META domain-containing protein [Leifsonia sp. AG29]|uniref:META domain-containing protein n=1 Tax=Leifsonia sp. AG29 TaxID=2598860 RepID=UPI00131C7788|nr:META domain-containing protein [Leifsonia sp. AG29]